MKRLYVIMLPMLVFSLLSGCNSQNTHQNQKNGNIELTVSAASSLKDALEEIKKEFEKENKNIVIHFNLGASGALQQQISHGAPVDLFFSAARDKFDILERDQLIKQGKNLVGNEIVLVVPVNSKKDIRSFDDLKNASKVSIGTPEIVPAGAYGRETLKTLKLWDKIAPKIVYAKDVSQALTYVETNNVDAGIVYRTDAKQSKKIKIVEEAPQDSHSPIVYPLGILKNTEHMKESTEFYDYLQGDKAMDILKKHGFKDIK
jgi:molybdate transport system substrate-binding protein